ncbi:hypothetical protein MBLNU459_g0900t1 [Dothideomycetes sp. NU459]
MSASNTQTTTAAPHSPSASFYDMSDDEEGEFQSIRHSKTDRGVKLLPSPQVYVHPTPSSKDNIAGYIALVQQKPSPSAPTSPVTASSTHNDRLGSSNLILAWLPESSLGDSLDVYVKVDLSDAESPPKHSHLVPPPPVTTSHSSSIRPPSRGWFFGSLVINTRAGDSFPALFFHDSECQSTIQQRKRLVRESFDPFGDKGDAFWGGDEVLRWLKRYVNVERSVESNIYLIDPTADDKAGFGSNPTPEKVAKALEGKDAKSPASASKSREGGLDPVTKALKGAGWNFLEKFSQVTTFTRRTAQAAADHRNLPPQLKRLLQNPEVQTVQDEFDSARLYLARWAMGIAEQSERDRNQRIWTAKDMLEMEDSEVGEFEILDVNTLSLDRRKPVTKKEWDGFFDSIGRLHLTPDEVKERIFHGGLDSEDGVRKEAWLFLLEVFPWDSTRDERKAKMNSLRDEYIRLKGAWWERMMDEDGTLEEREWWKEQKMRIDRNIPLFAGEDIPHPDPSSPFAEIGTNVHLEQMKDMLLTYNQHNRELGYVQGMSDLLAPIYAVTQDDAVAFWGFVGFMERMERNFLRDQSGMRLQLTTLDHLVQLLDPKLYLHLQSVDSTNFFFFFRMLLVWYKREFEWPDVLRLWEGLWTDYLSSNFHLFIAVAILEKHRDVIMEHLKGFDEVLKYVNELSNTIDLQSTLTRAEGLFRRFQRTVEAVDRKHSFPEPSVRQRKAPESAGQSPAGATGGSSTATEAGRRGVAGHGATGKAAEQQREKVISPELRHLLSRQVDKLDKKEVKQHGGGVGN